MYLVVAINYKIYWKAQLTILYIKCSEIEEFRYITVRLLVKLLLAACAASNTFVRKYYTSTIFVYNILKFLFI